MKEVLDALQVWLGSELILVAIYNSGFNLKAPLLCHCIAQNIGILSVAMPSASVVQILHSVPYIQTHVV